MQQIIEHAKKGQRIVILTMEKFDFKFIHH